MTAAKKSPPPPDATCQRGHLNAGKPKQKTKTKTKHKKNKPTGDFCTAFQRPGYH